MADITIYNKLSVIQQKLKVQKDQWNPFGKYKYRSCEGILENVKPYLKETGCVLTLTDEILNIGGKNYIKATATLTDGVNSVSTSAFAREADTKKGMDDSQITGTASSYARKYALNGLLAIDDAKDSDTKEYHEQTTQPKEESPDTPINAGKVETLKKLCEANGIEIKDVCTYFMRNKPEDITMGDWQELRNKENIKKMVDTIKRGNK